MNSSGGEKIRTLVKFPVKGLDMKKFLTEDIEKSENTSVAYTETATPRCTQSSPSQNDGELEEDPSTLYDLYGVVNHLGRTILLFLE